MYGSVAETTYEVRQPPRGMTYVVLSLVSMLGRNAYGVAIRDRLSQHISSDVPAAKVYVMLRRLEDYGFIQAIDQDFKESAGRKARPRRVYEITAPGQRALVTGAKLYENPVLPSEQGYATG